MQSRLVLSEGQEKSWNALFDSDYVASASATHQTETLNVNIYSRFNIFIHTMENTKCIFTSDFLTKQILYFCVFFPLTLHCSPLPPTSERRLEHFIKLSLLPHIGYKALFLHNNEYLGMWLIHCISSCGCVLVRADTQAVKLWNSPLAFLFLLVCACGVWTVDATH